MNKNRSPRVKSPVGEFGLIVIGVLVALLAESWWSERENRETERQILVDATAEFQENLEILDTDISVNIAVLDVLLAIEGLQDSALLALSDDEVSELFAVEKQFNAAFDPAMGSIDALVRSGDLRIIKDQALRLSLARWSALVTRAERMELQHEASLRSGFYRSVPAFAADGKWTSEERREIRDRLLHSKYSLELTMETMADLRATADEVLDRLLELTG